MRPRTADCTVIGIAGNRTQPGLVLGLRHPDGELHQLGSLEVSSGMLSARSVCASDAQRQLQAADFRAAITDSYTRMRRWRIVRGTRCRRA